MKKLAIFVEGQTEQIFVKKLVQEIAGGNRVSFQEEARGKNGIVVLREKSKANAVAHFVLIYDCGNDEQVRSQIEEHWTTLVKSYNQVMGVRDLYPKLNSQKAAVLRRMAYGMPTKPFAPVFILVLREVEAWFLQECTHLARLPKPISATAVTRECGVDPNVTSTEGIDHPSEVLGKLHRIGGSKYTKQKAVVQNVVDKLDYAHLYIKCKNLNQSFAKIVGEIDRFLS